MMFTIMKVFSYVQALHETTKRKKAERSYIFFSHRFLPQCLSNTRIELKRDHHTGVSLLGFVTSCFLILRNTDKVTVHICWKIIPGIIFTILRYYRNTQDSEPSNSFYCSSPSPLYFNYIFDVTECFKLKEILKWLSTFSALKMMMMFKRSLCRSNSSRVANILWFTNIHPQISSFTRQSFLSFSNPTLFENGF